MGKRIPPLPEDGISFERRCAEAPLFQELVLQGVLKEACCSTLFLQMNACLAGGRPLSLQFERILAELYKEKQARWLRKQPPAVLLLGFMRRSYQQHGEELPCVLTAPAIARVLMRYLVHPFYLLIEPGSYRIWERKHTPLDLFTHSWLALCTQGALPLAPQEEVREYRLPWVRQVAGHPATDPLDLPFLLIQKQNRFPLACCQPRLEAAVSGTDAYLCWYYGCHLLASVMVPPTSFVISLKGVPLHWGEWSVLLLALTTINGSGAYFLWKTETYFADLYTALGYPAIRGISCCKRLPVVPMTLCTVQCLSWLIGAIYCLSVCFPRQAGGERRFS